MKPVVALIYGGKSSEHEVSIKSAINIAGAIDKSAYDLIYIYVNKAGQWFWRSEINKSDDEKPIKLQPGSEQQMTAEGKPINVDVAFPIIHGTSGEDGSLQGVLEMLNINYVGPGVLSSAICMDKDYTKRLLSEAGISVAEGICLHKSELAEFVPDVIFEKLDSTSVFVKPARQGSSVGVSRANNEAKLLESVKAALKHDSKLIIEPMLVGDEIECAVLEIDGVVKASKIGRIITQPDDFYSYEAKYVSQDAAKLEYPAEIKTESAEQAQAIAVEVFKVLGCKQMARVDMFLLRDGRVVVNEVNTLPGFTDISMYPKLWEISGITQKELINSLLSSALNS